VDQLFWLSIAAAAIGLAPALYGVIVSSTGRMSPRDQQHFPTSAQAGRYYMCGGLAVVALSSATLLNHGGHAWWSLAVLAVAMILGSLAFLRYRPRPLSAG
jgi:hypothetical protein